MRFLAISALVTMALQLSAQAPVPPFEVVSVKPYQPGRLPETVATVLGANCNINGGRLTCPSSTVMQLIQMAFRAADGSTLRASQIVGGPDWVSTSRFEVVAVLSGALGPAEAEAGLRHVLESRFKLRSHHEQRSVPVYAVLTASRDGRLGPQMRAASTDCPQAPADARAPVRPSSAGARTCWGGEFRSGRFRNGYITMAQFASRLTNENVADRMVIDRTGLQGRFEVDLRWTPENVNANRELSDPVQSDTPGLFTAIREQLGLKLEPATENLDVLVIEQVEMPDPN